MGGYTIRHLDQKIQKYIIDNNFDQNNNGKIDEENGELAALLAAGKVKEIKGVSSWAPAVGVMGTGASVMGFGMIETILLDYCKAAKSHFKLVEGVTLGLAALGSVASWVLPFVLKENFLVMENEPKEQASQPKEPQNEWEEKYRQAFGEDTELKEYTPQKGEYWISILKAKYGVDDVTAQKMANKIKKMVYDDPKAAKQTPVMYLPETWTFEGKTYQYNDSVKVTKTQNYSDEVKTEMGKMSKDIKY